jgi:PAS domain S-box-containing protein
MRGDKMIEGGNGNNASILCVDDVKSIRDSIGIFLKKSGYNYLEAENGTDGLKLFRENRPDVVVLDLIMPDISGLDLLMEISKESPETPAIVMSGAGDMNDVIKAMRLGAFDYLPKPFGNMKILKYTIDRALEKVRLLRENFEIKKSLEEANLKLKERVKQRSVEAEKANELLKIELYVRGKTEEKLQASRERFKTIFENARDAIIYLDQDGMLIDANPRVYDLFGIRPEEARGCNLSEFSFMGIDYMQAVELYKFSEAGKIFPLFELEAYHKNGNKINIEINSRLIEENGKVKGVVNLVRDITDRKRLESKIIESYENVHKAKNATIIGLANLAEYRDGGTGKHLERIREYVKVLATGLSRTSKYKNYITEGYINDIYNSSVLHDIGKVSTPDSILLKPGKLTADEFEIMQHHTVVGGDIIKVTDIKIGGQSFLTLGREIAYYHHEKWCGTGYPKGLKGEEIPLSARIAALADVYDALTSKRPYKEAYTHKKAKEIIVEERGRQFDPEIVDVFLAYEDDFKMIRNKLCAVH